MRCTFLIEKKLAEVFEFGFGPNVLGFGRGTGLSREYTPPTTAAPVLAVDVPSGVAGLTGELVGRPFTAQRTVTFQALKPGLVLEPGATRCGLVEVADIGLAKLLDRAPADASLTGTNQVMGTPRYMAPEQMEGSHAVDHRFNAALIYSRRITAIFEMGISLGQTASHSPWLVQPPKPSASIWATILRARS